jgi:hypothetical protein
MDHRGLRVTDIRKKRVPYILICVVLSATVRRMTPRLSALSILACLVAALASATAAGPNPIYDAGKYTTSKQHVANGHLSEVNVPGSMHPFYVMHLYGNSTERGFAHGQLLSQTILNFIETQLPAYYVEEIDGLDVAGLPKWLQNMIKSLGKKYASKIAPIALSYVLGQQKKYLAASKANVFDEMSAIAAGVCSVGNPSKYCENGGAELVKTIEQVNMLPELIRMQCSMMGAWGKSTKASKLLQLRTLDFGGGPFGNRTMLVVNHPSNEGIKFATVGFPGFVGAVTGFSEKIGLCEKVDDVTAPKPKPKGSYKGQADSFVIRDVLQFSSTKEEAIGIMQRAHRTWPIWLGIGDFESQAFNAMEYTQDVVHVYDDANISDATNQTMFENVAYLDKHPQPSPHPDMPALVKQYYGTMTADNILQNFPRIMESGDVHIALYDFGENQAYVAVGTTNSTGSFVRKAYEAPFMKFDMKALWDAVKA